MFERLLFPTDFSKDSNNALQHAIQLTKFREGEIIVQHVVNNFFGPHSHWASLFDVHELQKQMDFHVDTEVTELLPGDARQKTTLRRLITQGKPPEQICKLAHEEMVDMVVMGSTSGITTMKVVRGVARPVLSVPVKNLGSDEVQPGDRILVATDFSRQSKKVTNYAFEVKKRFSYCPLYLIYAVKGPTAWGRMLRQDQVATSLEKSREWAENQTRNSIPDEPGSEVGVHTLVKWGRTSDCILQAADEIDASLIIMGAKGYGPAHHFYGTTVERVLGKVKCPVLTLQV